jgi:hypothetical protein
LALLVVTAIAVVAVAAVDVDVAAAAAATVTAAAATTTAVIEPKMTTQVLIKTAIEGQVLAACTAATVAVLVQVSGSVTTVAESWHPQAH